MPGACGICWPAKASCEHLAVRAQVHRVHANQSVHGYKRHPCDLPAVPRRMPCLVVFAYACIQFSQLALQPQFAHQTPAANAAGRAWPCALRKGRHPKTGSRSHSRRGSRARGTKPGRRRRRGQGWRRSWRWLWRGSGARTCWCTWAEGGHTGCAHCRWGARRLDAGRV